jgi:predicted aldo/keto reductase-like oxidoreductase
MEMRKLGKTGLQVGVIGLGTEHLLQQRETMEKVLREAVDAGANYIDLLYIDASGSDAAFWEHFGPILRPLRDRFILQGHWGSGNRWDTAYCRRCFEEVLERVGNGYVEVALLTMVDDTDKWNGWAQASIETMQRYKAQGRIGAIGLSTHEVPIALRAVRSGSIDVLMFGVNLIGHDDAPHQELYRACAEHEIGLVAMKPYFGGTLLTLDGAPTGITPAQCLSYVLSLPVSVAVPGAKDAPEFRAALRYVDATEAERDFRPALESIHQRLAGHCVYCNHCLPCPVGINIGSTILAADWARGGVTDELRSFYASLPVAASACVECGVCEERCPFGVQAIAMMQQAAALFEAA